MEWLHAALAEILTSLAVHWWLESMENGFFFYIWKDEILWAKSPVFIHVKKKREMGEVVSNKKLP